MKVPIACNLSDDAARDQLAEWRHLLATAVIGAKRTATTEVSLRLRGDPAAVMAAVRLAQREKACCPYFDFTLRIEAEALILSVQAPEDAASLLDGFASQAG